MKKLTVLLVAGLMVLFAFGTANAALLNGNQILTTYEGFYPDYTPYFYSFGQLTGGAGAVNDPWGGVWFNTVISDTNITVNFTGNGYFAPPDVPFDGLHFSDTLNNIQGFASVTVAGTNTSAFDASRITFDGNNIMLNFVGMNFSAGQIASVDITPTPIPGAVWLLGSGLLGLVGIGRKRLRK